MRVRPVPGTGQHILPILFLSYSAPNGPNGLFSSFGLSRAEFIPVRSHMLLFMSRYGAGVWCVGGGGARCCPGILRSYTIVSGHYVTFRRLKAALH